jgi:hypothetical protein
MTLSIWCSILLLLQLQQQKYYFIKKKKKKLHRNFINSNYVEEMKELVNLHNNGWLEDGHMVMVPKRIKAKEYKVIIDLACGNSIKTR